jgi:streptogramin lyase
MAEEPGKRFPSAGDLARAAEKALAALPPPAVPSARPPAPTIGELFTRAAHAVTPAANPSKRRIRRPRRPAAIAVMVGLATAVPIGLTAGGSSVRGVLHPAGQRVALAAFELGHPVEDAAVADGGLWTVDGTNGSVERFDLHSRRPAQQFIGSGEHLAAGRSHGWLLGHDGRLDDGSGSEGVSGGGDVAVGRDTVWILDTYQEKVLARTSGGSGFWLDATVPSPRAIASDGDSLWLLCTLGRVQRLSASGAPKPIGRELESGLAEPDDLAVGGGRVWVLDRDEGTVTSVDPGTGTSRVFRRDLGSGVRTVAYGEGALWIVYDDGRVVPQRAP